MSPARLHDDQVDVDAPTVRRLLDTQMPALAGLPLRAVASGGTENAVVRLGDELAVRLPLHEDAVGGLLKELQWLPALAPRLPLAVPEPVAVGEPDDAYPFPWAVVRWLPGEDAGTGRLTSTTGAADTLGSFVAALHGVDTTDAPAPGSEGFSRGLPLAGRDDAVRDALGRCEGLVDVDRLRAVWDDALVAPDWSGRPVWLHADLIPGNLLVRDGRLAGVLDFGAMATGDPAYDVIAAWQVLDAESRPAFRARVGADDDTWRRAAGLVVAQCVVALPYYLHTDPAMVAMAYRGTREVLEDVAP